MPAAGSGLRAHFHQVVRRGQDARVVIDHHYRVAVGQQVAHDAQQAVDVGRMQADRGLVQHVKHAGGAIAHGAC